jgi:hypothetical protein
MDTRPIAQRWRGSAVREPAAVPLKRGTVDVAGLRGFTPANDDCPRPAPRAPIPVLRLLAIVALSALTIGVATVVMPRHVVPGHPAASAESHQP